MPGRFFLPGVMFAQSKQQANKRVGDSPNPHVRLDFLPTSLRSRSNFLSSIFKLDDIWHTIVISPPQTMDQSRLIDFCMQTEISDKDNRPLTTG